MRTISLERIMLEEQDAALAGVPAARATYAAIVIRALKDYCGRDEERAHQALQWLNSEECLDILDTLGIAKSLPDTQTVQERLRFHGHQYRAWRKHAMANQRDRPDQLPRR